jgi:hypothetical protein
MDKKLAVGIAIGCVVCCLVAVLSVMLAGTAFLTWLAEEPEGIRVDVDAPLLVTKGEPFIITVQVENTATEARVLDSIDIEATYLDGVGIQKVDPPYLSSSRIGWGTGFQTFLFQKMLLPGDGLAVHFHALGVKVGDYAGDLDVCVDDGVHCRTVVLRTVVEE